MRRVPLSLLAAGVLGCARGEVGVRDVSLAPLPTCPARSDLAEPLVVRLERDRGPLDRAYVQTRVLHSLPAKLVLRVPRERMRGSLRVGVCARTSLGTADCAAARWLGESTFALDDHAAPTTIAWPAPSVPCAPTR
jgi:hypothetical protein